MNTLNDFQLWLNIINTLGLIAVGVTVWLRKPGVDAAAAISKMGSDQAVVNEKHGTRLTQIETNIKHMPNGDDLRELEGSMKAIRAEIQGMTHAFGRQEAQVTRIADYLMNKKL